MSLSLIKKAYLDWNGVVYVSLLPFLLCVCAVSNVEARNVAVYVDIDVVPSQHGRSMSRIEHLAYGGFTPSYKPSGMVLSRLANDGFRSMRLINVEWDNKVILGDNGLEGFIWSKKFKRELRTCRRLGLVPHIIIGQVVPDGLQVSGEGNERRGVKDWGVYRYYIHAALDYIVKYWRFNEVVLEVGNEMDNPKFNWLPVEPLEERLDPSGYIYYLKLFKHISEVVEKYRQENPKVNILLGGPALTQNSMNHSGNSERNWLARFAHDVVANGMAIDFFSMHFYGSAGSREEFKHRIELLDAKTEQAGRKLPVWITEWGASAFFQHKNENFLPDAGAFGLDFLNTAARLGVENTLFIAAARHTDKSKSGPALLNRDGTASHAYRGIELLRELSGKRLRCSSDVPEVSCVASRNDDEINVVLWHTGWARRHMGNTVWLKSRVRRYIRAMVRFMSVNSVNGALYKRESWKLGRSGDKWHRVLLDGDAQDFEIEIPDNAYINLRYNFSVLGENKAISRSPHR